MRIDSITSRGPKLAQWFTSNDVHTGNMRRDNIVKQAERTPSPLDPWALGLTGGVTLAVWVVFIGVLARIGWGDRWRQLFADLYPGYGSSALGLAIGASWAFVDGFTVGAAFAWLYNTVAD